MEQLQQLNLFDTLTRMPKFSVLDFETGGLDPERHGLASVGIMRLDESLMEIDRDYFLMYESDKVYDAEALSVNKLELAQLKSEGLVPTKFIPRIRQFVDGTIMVNHNSAFDVKWLNCRGFDIQESIDTMVWSMQLYPYQKAKLGIAANREGIAVVNAHNAMADVEMTAELLRRYAKKNPDCLIPKKIMWDRFKR